LIALAPLTGRNRPGMSRGTAETRRASLSAYAIRSRKAALEGCGSRRNGRGALARTALGID